MKNYAIYPGTFDPFTSGHFSIIKRGLKVFDNLIVLVANNTQKTIMFSVEDRLHFINKVIDYENLQERVKVDSFDSLLVDYCKKKEITTVIRGIRPLIDFDYEFELAMTNRQLYPDLETVFILTDEEHFYLRSTLVKDVIRLGGDVGNKLHPAIKKEILDKIIENS